MALPANRRRSSTLSSIRSSSSSQSAAPLSVGDQIVLTAWVHEFQPGNAKARLNLDAWPGCTDGDLIAVTHVEEESLDGAFFFMVAQDRATAVRLGTGTMQITLDSGISTKFGFYNRGDVRLTKVDKALYTAEHVEIYFRDQYLGRSEMWRLGMSLENDCVYSDQKITFAACIEAQIRGIFMKGQRVHSAYITSLTKTIYRSLSARHTLLIQISRELWEFAEDGERYYEKLCHSFLPTLFTRWAKAGANHLLTVVLVSRVYYDDAELEFASGPLLQDKSGHSYKDLYKVILDLEIMEEPESMLFSLKQSLWDFQREILLAKPTSPSAGGLAARLIGRISYAHEGNILEALNLALNPFERYHIDRDMGRTGLCLSFVTPGTGRFEVDKDLLRLTNERMSYNGFVVDLVCLTHRPLHVVPLLAYMSHQPEDRYGISQKEMNPLYYDTPDSASALEKPMSTYYMIPSWMYCSYWERSWDMPFRSDRFIPRCRMYEIQMLGLLEQDVSSTISIPYLDDDGSYDGKLSTEDRERARKRHARSVFGRRQEALIFAPLAGALSSGSTLSGIPKSLRARDATFSGVPLAQGSPQPGNLPEIIRDHFPAPAESISSTVVAVDRSASHTANEDFQSGGATPDTAASMPIIVPPISMPADASAGLEKDDLIKPGSSPSGTSIRSTTSKTSDRSLLPTKTRGGKFGASWLLSSFRQPPVPTTTMAHQQGVPTILQKSDFSQPVTLQKQQPATETSNVAQKRDPPVLSVPVTSRKDPVQGRPEVPLPIPARSIAPIPQPISIKPSQANQLRVHRKDSDGSTEQYGIHPARSSYSRNSIHGESAVSKRETDESTPRGRYVQLSSGVTLVNPSNPKPSQIAGTANDARRWKHSFPQPTFEHQMKWKSLCMPASLPLTTDTFPTYAELEADFKMYGYEVAVVSDLDNVFIRSKPKHDKSHPEDYKARMVMQSMSSFRLAQGFQFVVAPRSPRKGPRGDRFSGSLGRGLAQSASSFASDPNLELKPGGASEVLKNIGDAPIYLSMGNQIHRILFHKTERMIRVQRYVREKQRDDVYKYKCLIWPQHGSGYVHSEANFLYPTENVGWNRMDMLLAGYENQLSDTLRYWRARFVVIPSEHPPDPAFEPGPCGKPLSDEEIRLAGVGRLAELIGSLRWVRPEEKRDADSALRLLMTSLDPLACLLDENLMEQLAEIHSPMPRDRRRKAEKAIEGASLTSVARAMRDPEGGLLIGENKWHQNVHVDSFKGSDFVTWLMREYRDINTRDEGEKAGQKLMHEGLFRHSRANHGFMDGHYFYALTEEYAFPSPVKRHKTWFKPARRDPSQDSRRGKDSGSSQQKRTLVLTQSIILDLDPMQHSDQAEIVVLHHDIIHNPSNAFHFELHWIATTARYIDDIVQLWNREAEDHGLTLVEAYVDQISDISKHSPFQSCIDIPLALAPPEVPDLSKHLAPGAPSSLYFECALLRELGYILDIEGSSRYSDQADVKYSYKRSTYTYPQYIHRTGLAFVQVKGGTGGFQWLANGLAIASISTRRLKRKQWDQQYALLTEHDPQPAKQAEAIRHALQEVCSNKDKLQASYARTLADLAPGPPVKEVLEDRYPY